MFNQFLEGRQGLNIFIMKKVVLFVAIACISLTLQAQTQKEVKQDSVKLFYGMTAKKFIMLSVPQGKALIKEKNITVTDYFKAKANAERYLDNLQIKKDSIETMRIYDRIGKKLGMKKDGGEN